MTDAEMVALRDRILADNRRFEEERRHAIAEWLDGAEDEEARV